MTTPQHVPANHIRVRVKEGAKLSLGRSGNKAPHFAVPGSWINLPADWLKQAAIAAAVETEDQYVKVAVAKDQDLAARARQSEEAADYFFKSRAAHRANAIAAVGARADAERMSSDGVLDEHPDYATREAHDAADRGGNEGFDDSDEPNAGAAVGARADLKDAVSEDPDEEADQAPDGAAAPPEGGRSRVRRKS